MTKKELIQFDYGGALLGDPPQFAEALAPIWSELDRVKNEMLNHDIAAFRGTCETPEEKTPLDAGFMELPDRLLESYDADRQNSELGEILATAKRIRETVDRVVVIGIGGSYMGARALMDACCEPYFNELTRADRGGRPRMYFAGNNVDNDATQGLLHLLRQTKNDEAPGSRWAIVVISKSGGTIESAVAFRQFLRALEQFVDAQELPDLVIPVTGPSGKLFELANAIGCRDRFSVPEGVGGRFSVLSAVGLLPAAILGLDIVALLNGAWLMNGHFQSASASENIVLQYVAINHLLETRGASIRLLSVWNQSLETLGWWYDQLLAESLGKQQQGATPITVVNTRDLHSRAQQHQQGSRDKIVNNLVVQRWRCDALAVGSSQRNQDGLNELADKTLPEIMEAATQGTNQAYRDDDRPTTTISLPIADEHSLGQFFQMMMLATVAEGRLINVNPYGQPGVEMYKNNMSKILKES